MLLLNLDPLIDGSWDIVLYAVCNFIIVGHPSTMVVNERVEIVIAEAFVHVGEIVQRKKETLQ